MSETIISEQPSYEKSLADIDEVIHDGHLSRERTVSTPLLLLLKMAYERHRLNNERRNSGLPLPPHEEEFHAYVWAMTQEYPVSEDIKRVEPDRQQELALSLLEREKRRMEAELRSLRDTDTEQSRLAAKVLFQRLISLDSRLRSTNPLGPQQENRR